MLMMNNSDCDGAYDVAYGFACDDDTYHVDYDFYCYDDNSAYYDGYGADLFGFDY